MLLLELDFEPVSVQNGMDGVLNCVSYGFTSLED